MTCEEIIDRLRTLGIPSAYSHFKSPPSLPFVVYTVPNDRRYGADNRNMLKSSTVHIELYTEAKDEELENAVAELFSEYELDGYEDYLQEEQMYMKVFEFETVMKTGG